MRRRWPLSARGIEGVVHNVWPCIRLQLLDKEDIDEHERNDPNDVLSPFRAHLKQSPRGILRRNHHANAVCSSCSKVVMLSMDIP